MAEQINADVNVLQRVIKSLQSFRGQRLNNTMIVFLLHHSSVWLYMAVCCHQNGHMFIAFLNSVVFLGIS